MLARAFLTPRIAGALGGLALYCLVACGDDEEPVDAGPAELLAAGKACESDEQCAAGMCLDMLPGAFGGAAVLAPGGYCSGECMNSADCGKAAACSGAFAGLPGGIGMIRGRCLSTCTQSSDCRTGYRCVNALGLPVTPTTFDAGVPSGLLGASTCQPAPETDKLEDGVVGSMCAADGDCGDGRCLRMSNAASYPGGYCSGRCLQDADCGATGSCTAGLAGGAGSCFLRCASDSDCKREGYRCRVSAAMVMQCVPGAARLPDDVVGRSCSADPDCGNAAMSCGMRLGRYAAPGGYCTQRCVNASDCGRGGVCVGSRGGSTPSGTCYKACADVSECREGYTCGPAGNTGSAAMQNICSVTPPPMQTEDAGI
jgi:hypothetical protein